MQVSEAGGPAPSERSVDGNPAALLLEAARRHWLLLSIIVVVSGAGAAAIAWQMKVEYVTAHMVMKPRRLPMVDAGLYQIPDPTNVASEVKSPLVLEEVAINSDFGDYYALARSLRVSGDSRSQTLSFTLAAEDSKHVAEVLEQIGESVGEHIKTMRTRLMGDLLKKINDDDFDLGNEVDAARTELAIAQQEAKALGNDALRLAEMQALVAQKLQLESNLASAKRRQQRILRDSQRIASRITDSFFSGVRKLIAERRQQIEVLGQGLKSTTRTVGFRNRLMGELNELEKLVDELDELEKIVHERLDDESVAAAPGDETTPLPDAGADSAAEENVAAVADPPAVEDEESEIEESDAARRVREVAELAEKAVEEFRNWHADISGVGQGSVGDLDQQSQAFTGRVESDLRNWWEQAAVLSIELSDIETDLLNYASQLSELGQVKSLTPQFSADSDSIGKITKVMDRTAALQELEGAYFELSKHRKRVEALQELVDVNEYYVSSPASFDPEKDVKSNFMKLFVFAFGGIGVVLTLPLVFFEWLKFRPTPVSVISRRWNLPSLGIQTGGRTAARLPATNLSDEANSLRLMALRIQQSLFQPSGKVVLFSSFDHRDSPMSLIRSLANCFAMREESVLIIQTLPCEVENHTAEGAGTGGSRRKGVAEYLAGECDDLDELVKGTGVVGIDFLPGGCTATASEAMASSRLTTLIDHFRDQYSMILLNGPSTYLPADLQMLAARADGIVFTVNNQSLRGVYGGEVLSDLIELGAPILGFAESTPAGKHAVPQKPAAVSGEPSPAASLVS